MSTLEEIERAAAQLPPEDLDVTRNVADYPRPALRVLNPLVIS